MKTSVRNGAIIVIALIILFQSGLISSVLYFLIAGVVPGTQFSLPSWCMFIIWILALSLLSYKLWGKEFAQLISGPAIKTKKQLPRRRYQRI